MNLGIGTTGYSADVAGDEPGEFFAVRSDLEYTTLTIDGFSYGVGVGARYDLTDTIAVHGSYRINWIDFDNADSTPDFDGKVAGG
jgi:opacity protein-like surface antigen